MKITGPSSILTPATRTLFASYGFQRVWLTLVLPGKDRVEAKVGYGPITETIQALFHCSLARGTFWDRLLHQFYPIQYSSFVKEGKSGGMTPEFLKYRGDHPGFAGTLYAPCKPTDFGRSRFFMTAIDRHRFRGHRSSVVSNQRQPGSISPQALTAWNPIWHSSEEGGLTHFFHMLPVGNFFRNPQEG